MTGLVYFSWVEFKEFTSAPTAPLVVLAYHQTGFPDSDNDLALILPILISSIRMNSALDECLLILLKFLHRIRASYVSLPLTLSTEMVTPLCAILPTIPGAHPDPVVRQSNHRVALLHETKPFRITTLPVCLARYCLGPVHRICLVEARNFY